MLIKNRDGGVLRLTLARAEKRNAFDAPLARALVEAVGEADADAAVGAVLLDAEGSVFSAGMDLEEAVGADPGSADPLALGRLHQALFGIRAGLRTPLVAAVQGAAFGGALGLLANAHLVVAADTAQFGLTEIRVGMWPFLAWRPVAEAIGARRTMELSLTGRVFGVAEALAYGLVHFVVPAERVAGRALELARTIAGASPDAVARGLHAAADPDAALALRAEQFASLDFQEGVRAFREKRAPRWPSRRDG